MYTKETFQLSNRPDIRYTEIAGIALLGVLGIAALGAGGYYGGKSLVKTRSGSAEPLLSNYQPEEFVSLAKEDNSYLYQSFRRFFQAAQDKNLSESSTKLLGDITSFAVDAQNTKRELPPDTANYLNTLVNDATSAIQSGDGQAIDKALAALTKLITDTIGFS